MKITIFAHGKFWRVKFWQTIQVKAIDEEKFGEISYSQRTIMPNTFWVYL